MLEAQLECLLPQRSGCPGARHMGGKGTGYRNLLVCYRGKVGTQILDIWAGRELNIGVWFSLPLLKNTLGLSRGGCQGQYGRREVHHFAKCSHI